MSNSRNESDEQHSIIENIAYGVYSNVPKSIPSQIRIFISSTFTDFGEERNYLFENTYRSLRKFCQEEYEKELFFVDLRWGITDYSTNDNLTIRICLEELDRCQRESIGPAFIAFLGNRYGTRFLIENIEKNEFKAILDNQESRIEYKLGAMKVPNLLEYCYELDENGRDVQYYKLKSIEIILKEVIRSKRGEEWMKIQKILIATMRKCAVLNYEKKVFTEEQKNKYFISATENEIQKGILDLNDMNKIKSNCLVFIREMEEFDPEEERAKPFTDDYQEATELQATLKSKIRDKGVDTKIFKINWLQAGKFQRPFADELKRYLGDFSYEFLFRIRQLIQFNMENIVQQNNSPFFEELKHHARFCDKLVATFQSRKITEYEIEQYLDSENRKPYFIIGESGSGKSTIIANIYKKRKVKEEMKIIRFIGTSKGSSNIISVMQSIIDQLDLIYQLPERLKKSNVKTNTSGSSVEKSEKFQEILNYISEINQSSNKRVLIFLDSLDQLSVNDYGLEWIFYELPKTIKIVYSVITIRNSESSNRDLLVRIYEKFEYNKENFLELDFMDRKETRVIITNLLEKQQRLLSVSQWLNIEKLLKNIDSKGIYPLHIKLLVDVVSKWTSRYNADYDDRNDFYSCTNTINTIKYLFNKLENIYGQMLFSRCVFYLTLFEYNGISESELEDIMSIDDDVLTSVFQYHHPPSRRFPIVLWIRIKHEINDYLTNKEIDNMSVVSWFHRSFIEASKDYYQDLFKSSPERDKVIMNVVDYFTEKWNDAKSNGEKGEMKEFHFENEEFKNSILVNLAYRNTKSQKIMNQNRFNYRKLNEFVNVILMLNNENLKVELLLKYVFLDCEFMYAKAWLQDLYFVVDLLDVVEKIKEKSERVRVRSVCSMLSKYEPNKTEEIINELVDTCRIFKDKLVFIQQNPSSGLAFVVARHLPTKKKSYDEFSKQCGLVLQQHNMPLIDEELRVIFKPKNETILNVYWNKLDERYFVVETKANNFKDLYIIETNTTRIILKLSDSHNKIENFKVDQIVMSVKKTNDIGEKKLSLTDFSGRIYFSNDDKQKMTFYSLDIENMNLSYYNWKYDHEIYKKENDLNWNSVLVLDINYYLVLFKCGFSILDVSNSTIDICETEIYENETIKYFDSTITKGSIYSLNDYNSINSITFIIGLSNNQIKVFRYYAKANILSKVCQIFNSADWSSFCIDRCFSIEYTNPESDLFIDSNNNTDSFRLAVMVGLNKVVKVYNVNYVGSTYREVTTINETILKVRKRNLQIEKEFEIISFFNNVILLKYFDKENEENNPICIYSYYLGEKKRYDMKELVGHMYLVEQNTLLVFSKENCINVYTVKNNKIYQIGKRLKIDFTLDYKMKYVFKLNNNKLYVNDLKSIIQIDARSMKQQRATASEVFEVGDVLSVLDDDHLLLWDLRSSFMIFNCPKNKIVKYFKPHMCNQMLYNVVSLIRYTDEYLVLGTKDNHLLIYYIKKKGVNRFEFVLIFVTVWSYRIIQQQNSSMAGCFILNFGDINKFYITTIYLDKDKKKFLDVSVINHKLNDTSIRKYVLYEAVASPDESFWVSLDTPVWENSISLKFFVTRLNRHMIFLNRNENGLKDICTVDTIEVYNEPIKSELSEIIIENVFSIDGVDDFLVCCKKSIYRAKIDNNNEVCLKGLLFYENKTVKRVHVEHGYLFVQNEESFELYDLKDIFLNKINLVFTINKTVHTLSISNDKKYLALGTTDNEIILFKLSNIQPFHEQIGYLQLDYTIEKIFVNRKHLAIMFAKQNGYYKLLSFLIVNSKIIRT